MSACHRLVLGLDYRTQYVDCYTVTSGFYLLSQNLVSVITSELMTHMENRCEAVDDVI